LLREAVEEVLAHQELSRELVTQARERLTTTFSYEGMIKDTEQVLLHAAKDGTDQPLAPRAGDA
ncbi:MAG: hypothetical protein ACREJ4_17460, partial [Candidatus Methylomirabilaceae bacterium]